MKKETIDGYWIQSAIIVHVVSVLQSDIHVRYVLCRFHCVYDVFQQLVPAMVSYRVYILGATNFTAVMQLAFSISPLLLTIVSCLSTFELFRLDFLLY